MSFRLTSAPTAFMDMMNRIFKIFIDMYMIVFIVEILIYSRNEAEHEDHLRSVYRGSKSTNCMSSSLSLNFCLPLYLSLVT